jgi:hypothetical protein
MKIVSTNVATDERTKKKLHKSLIQASLTNRYVHKYREVPSSFSKKDIRKVDSRTTARFVCDKRDVMKSASYD